MAAFAEIGARWDEEGLRRGAWWFAVACACLPAIDVIDAYSLVEAGLSGLSSGGLPATPLRAWGMLAWVIGAAWAAAWALRRASPRGRSWLFAACAGLHAIYALASGLGPATLLAGLCFALAWAGVRGAGPPASG